MTSFIHSFITQGPYEKTVSFGTPRLLWQKNKNVSVRQKLIQRWYLVHVLYRNIVGMTFTEASRRVRFSRRVLFLYKISLPSFYESIPYCFLVHLINIMRTLLLLLFPHFNSLFRTAILLPLYVVCTRRQRIARAHLLKW